MILRKGGKGPRTLALATLLVFVTSMLAFGGQARATLTDLINNPPTGWSVVARACSGGSCSSPELMTDADDTTYGVWSTAAGVCGAGGSPRTCRAYVQFARSSGVSTALVKSFRAVWGWGAGGTQTITTVSLEVYDGANWVTCYTGGAGSPGTILTDCPTGLNLNPGAGAVYARVNFIVPDSSNADLRLYSWELYSDSVGPESVDITNYVYNLRMYHPAFVRRISWEFVELPEWAGAWDLKDSAGGIKGSGDHPGAHAISIDIPCVPVCGTDTYTLTVHDTMNNKIASYAIDGEVCGSSGSVGCTVIGDTRPPYITSATFCYQSTSAQCDATFTSVGLVKVNYTFTGTPTVDYSISAGQLATGRVAPNMASVGVSGTHVPGTYTLYIPVANVSTSGEPFAVLLIVAPSAARAFAQGPLNFTSGGSTTVTSPPEPADTPPPCAQFDVVCGIGSLFNIAQSAIVTAFQNAVTGVMSRQPFSFLFNSAAAATAQFQRAQAAVTNSSTCSGVAFTMPSLPPVTYTAFGAEHTSNPRYYAFNGNVPSPSPFAFSALRCQDLEPWGGSTWWQGLRAVMGPALILGYAFQLFRRYEVKPVIG